MKKVFCGIDLGGTTIDVGIIAEDGVILSTEKMPSFVERGVDDVVGRIVNAVLACGKSVGTAFSIAGAGIGVAGLVDNQNGVLREATNFPGWINVPLGAKLQDVLKVSVTVDNDANVAALGEYVFGAGRGYPYLMMVTLGTGVGAGLIINGEIYHGAYGAAGEFGHITIDKNGPLCACGRRGCVEAYVGTSGILRTVKERLPAFPKSRLAAVDVETVMPKDIYREAMAGDELARSVFFDVGDNLGYGLGNVVNLLNVQRIILGGGVAAAGDFIIKSAQKRLDMMSLNNSETPVKIVPAELAEKAGIFGAASLAMANL
ncbi:ROK family protein [candidate division KSB1 bacterium]|nr:ROK family protein [candidate division KSB1 bacterium]